MARRKSNGIWVAAVVVVSGIVIGWSWGLDRSGAALVLFGFGFGMMSLAASVYQAAQAAKTNRNRVCGRLKTHVLQPLDRPFQINDFCHNQDSADGNGCPTHRNRNRYLP